jgi:GNAT superfamily N-acetyltransferase
VIREPGPADAEAIAMLLGELGYASTADTIGPRLVNLQRERSTIALVAEEERQIIGLATCHVFFAIHADEPAAFLTALVVAESSRRRGAGRALVAQIEAWARARGATRLAVVTALHRGDAHAFYEQLGFDHTGRRYGKTLA